MMYGYPFVGGGIGVLMWMVCLAFFIDLVLVGVWLLKELTKREK